MMRAMRVLQLSDIGFVGFSLESWSGDFFTVCLCCHVFGPTEITVRAQQPHAVLAAGTLHHGDSRNTDPNLRGRLYNDPSGAAV